MKYVDLLDNDKEKYVHEVLGRGSSHVYLWICYNMRREKYKAKILYI